MFCFKEERNSRHGNGSTCSGNLSVLSGIEVRECGFLFNVSLCRAHQRELLSGNKKRCCFPLIKSDVQCAANTVPCPQRLFAVFDSCQTLSYNYIPGTYIYHKHLNSVDKDERICSKDEYVPPKTAIATKFELVP